MSNEKETLKKEIEKLKEKIENYEVDVESQEVIGLYEDALDCDGAVTVGSLEFWPSDILKKLDPIAYNCGLNDYAESMEKSEYENLDDYQTLESELEDLENDLEDLEDKEAVTNEQ